MAGGKTLARRSLLWAGLTCLIAAVVGAMSYWTGVALQGDRDAAADPATVPSLLPLRQVYTSTRARAYARGRHDGLGAARLSYEPGGAGFERIFRRAQRAALGGADLQPRAWYLIATSPDGRAVARSFRLEPAHSYALCRGDGAVCARRLGGR